MQYASVIAFGTVRIVDEAAEKRRALYGLLDKCFPELPGGKDNRPITDSELARTSVYAMAIASWSGKENWREAEGQNDE